MGELVSPLLVVVLLLNFFLLGTTRIVTAVRTSALQGAVLGLLALVVHGTGSLSPWLVALGAALVKGVAIPALLLRALRDVAIRREMEPLLGPIPSLVAGALATGAATAFTRRLPLAPEHQGSLIVPAALATVLVGLLLLVTRRKAITQVVGYLVLENGIYLMGLTLLGAVPFLVELGVLLDLLVAIFVMGIMIHHIHREFSSLDTAQLSALRH